MSLTKVSYAMIDGASLNIKDFGAIGDGTTNDTSAIQNALDAANAAGGGSVYVPVGEYVITSPLRVFSNTTLYGDGAASLIHNKQPVYTIACNVIHIGWGYEWNENGVSFDPASNNDATITELLANDFSNIKVNNIKVCNLGIKGTAPVGLGIWCLNAQNVVIDSIWSTDTRTPVSVANDAAGWPAACHNVSVSNIFQVSALGGASDWYDLVWVGQALDVSISRCFNNPNTPSGLDSMIFSAGHNVTISDCNLQGDLTVGKIGISVIGASLTTLQSVLVNNNTIRKVAKGIVVFQTAGVAVKDNVLDSNTVALQAYCKNSHFDGNTFVGNITALIGNSDATSNVFTNNRGMQNITPWTVSTTNDYEDYNFFDGNEQPITAATSNDIPAGMLSRKTEFFPYEAFLSISDQTKLSSKDTTLSLTTPGTVDIFFRIPYDARKIISVDGALYTTTASQTLAISIVGTTQFANVSSFTTHETLGTYTTTTAGDQLWNFTSTTPKLYNNGAYFLKITLTTTAALSFRMVRMNLRAE
jgi:hypothetical protein